MKNILINTNKSYLSKDNWVAKRNMLNEMRANKMTLQELRFFAIYLSKINSDNISTRTLIFPLDNFVRIMNIDRVRTNEIKQATDRLLCKIISVPN